MDKYRSEVLSFMEAVKGRSFFCFDTETTGLSPVDNDIIEFSAVKYQEEGGKYREVSRFDIYINPEYEILAEITEITGITTEMLKGCPNSSEAAWQIAEYLGDSPILIGYNSVSFDEKFVKSLYRKTTGKDFTPSFHLDVLKMAREKCPKPHKLIDMATRAGVAEGLRFHSSIDDALATFAVFEYLLPMYAEPEPAENGDELKIIGLRRWTKSATLDRLYVGNKKNWPIYLDIPKDEWFIGANIDDVQVISAIYEFAGVTDNAQLVSKYR